MGFTVVYCDDLVLVTSHPILLPIPNFCSLTPTLARLPLNYNFQTSSLAAAPMAINLYHKPAHYRH